jgi:hypothetical protein
VDIFPARKGDGVPDCGYTRAVIRGVELVMRCLPYAGVRCSVYPGLCCSGDAWYLGAPVGAFGGRGVKGCTPCR